jgi:hypothetical protein
MKLLFLLFCSFNAFSWTHLDATRDHFPSNTITINVAGTTCANAGISSSVELMSLAMSAVNKFWNKVPTSSIQIVQGAVTAIDVDGLSLSDMINTHATAGTILVGCNDDVASFSGGSTLGVGTFGCISASDCRGALLLNSHANSPIPASSSAQKLATIAHEIGHAFGLGHSSDAIALMFYADDGRKQNYLTTDDIDGVSYLYPQDKVLSCGTISQIQNDDWISFIGNFTLGFLMIFLFGLLGKKKRRVQINALSN